MGRRMQWSEVVRGVGDSLIDVVRAELAVVAGEWKRSGRRLGIALGLLAMAGALLFWLLALVLATAVLWLATTTTLHLWQAGLAVGGGALLLILVLAGVGAFLLRGLDNPMRTVRRQLDEHLSWWQQEVLQDPISEGEADGEAGRGAGALGAPAPADGPAGE